MRQRNCTSAGKSVSLGRDTHSFLQWKIMHKSGIVIWILIRVIITIYECIVDARHDCFHQNQTPGLLPEVEIQLKWFIFEVARLGLRDWSLSGCCLYARESPPWMSLWPTSYLEYNNMIRGEKLGNTVTPTFYRGIVICMEFSHQILVNLICPSKWLGWHDLTLHPLDRYTEALQIRHSQVKFKICAHRDLVYCHTTAWNFNHNESDLKNFLCLSISCWSYRLGGSEWQTLGALPGGG